MTFLLQMCLKAVGYDGPHLAYSFNYARLPQGLKDAVHRFGFDGIDRFVVYSSIERQIYHRHFGIPLEKLEFAHWGVGAPQLAPAEVPLVPGGYVCALGENSRDYRTLASAAARLPSIPFVWVVRPHNLVGLNLPPNVRALSNIPLAQAINVLAFSRFMALPLIGSEVPCGHVTLVNAMHLGKAFAITRSAGVTDYVRDGENSLMCEPGNVEELAGSIERLWLDRELCTRLGEAGRHFAANHCTAKHALAHFVKILDDLGVPH